MKQKISFPLSSFLRITLFLLLLAMLDLGSGCSVLHLTASAAGNSPSATAKVSGKIPFRNNSGHYLRKIGSDWYLYNKNGKPLTGLRHVNVARGKGPENGFYMFNRRGKLIHKKSVYHLKKETAAGVTFNGWYYFDRSGRLCTNADFHTVKQTVDVRKFNGRYYFGGKNGKLCQKKGWISCRGKRYYINAKGKMLTNRWKSSYYLQADGTIAYSKKLPDGSYVDYNGHKCSGPDAALSSLGSQLQSMVRGYNGTWSIYVKDLKTGGVISINDRSMSPASTIKAFVMAATYDRIYHGKLSFTSTIRSLLNSMITVSDNESYNELVRCNSSSHSFLSGASEINSYLSRNGYSYTRCRHTLQPSSSNAGYGSNSTSAKECGVLLEKIYRGKCVSAAYSKEMLNLLCAQTRRWKIPAGLPSGVKTANKTGENNSVQNDMAIVFGPKTDYVICVFSATGNEAYSVARIRSISRKVYDYLN